MNARWHLGLTEPDPPQWLDLSEALQVELCCEVMEGDHDWLFDALVSMRPAVCIAALRRMDGSALGLEMRRAVLDTLRKEVERRMDDGELV